jgi:hypothetical protein
MWHTLPLHEPRRQTSWVQLVVYARAELVKCAGTSKYLRSLLPTDKSIMSLPAALADDLAASITKKAPDSGVRADRSLTIVLNAAA